MTVVYTADVFCDRCGVWEHGTTGRRQQALATVAIETAKKLGWSRQNNSMFLDLCPKCLDKTHKGEV